MIAYIKGKIIESGGDYIVVCVSEGVGYKVFIPDGTSEKLDDIGEVELYTTQVIRENEHKIFGFSSPQERNFFELLNTVTGVGPRVAVSLLGTSPWSELARDIVDEDVVSIVRTPGVGKKMAMRIIVELKDKILGKGIAAEGERGRVDGERKELISQALRTLGFKSSEIGKILEGTAADIDPGLSVEESLKLVLQRMNQACPSGS